MTKQRSESAASLGIMDSQVFVGGITVHSMALTEVKKVKRIKRRCGR